MNIFGFRQTKESGETASVLFDAFASYATDPDRDIVRNVAAFLEGLHENPLLPELYRHPLRICVHQDFKLPKPRTEVPTAEHEAGVATLIKELSTPVPLLPPVHRAAVT